VNKWNKHCQSPPSQPKTPQAHTHSQGWVVARETTLWAL
jgi:hypothetical protein